MKYWHFLPEDKRLRYRDREIVRVKHTFMLPPETKIIPCKVGFHASLRPLDALQYAPGPIICRVTLHGDIVPHGDPIDKYAAHGRTVLWMADATATLQAFTRWSALQVIHLWDAPQVVVDYLNTGDESLRAAARAAARDAGNAGATRDAAWAARAARDAARPAGNAGAAWAAARAARDAARDARAARDAARDAQNAQLETMILALEQEAEK